MKLNEFMEKPLGEALREMNLIDCNVHTDDTGAVRAVELKYRPYENVKAATVDPDCRNW